VQTGPEKNPRGPPRSPGLPLDINLHDKSSPESKSKAVSFRPNQYEKKAAFFLS